MGRLWMPNNSDTYDWRMEQCRKFEFNFEMSIWYFSNMKDENEIF